MPFGNKGEAPVPEDTSKPADKTVVPADKPAGATETKENQVPPILDEFISKLRIQIGETGNQMRKVVMANIMDDLSNTEQTLLAQSFPEDVLEKAYTESITDSDVSILKGLNWADTSQTETNMAKLRTHCLQEFFGKLEASKNAEVGQKSKERSSNENKEAFDKWTESHIGKLEDRIDLTGDEKTNLTALKEKVTAYQTTEDDKKDATGYTDKEAKITDFEKDFQPIFDTYKGEVVAKLKEEKVDTAKLEAETDFDKFIIDLEAIEAVKAPKTAETTSGKGIINGILDAFGLNDPSVTKYLDAVPFMGLLLVLLSKFGLIDGLIKEVPDSKTREVFIDLTSSKGHYAYKEHKEDDKDWLDHLTNRQKAESWATSLQVAGGEGAYNKGRDTVALGALFNSTLTIGKLKERAKGGDNETELDAADLPGNLQNSFPFVENVYKEIMKDEPVKNGIQHDGETLTSYVATNPNLYKEPLVAKKDEPATTAATT